ncbi:MAG: hypothetical protein ACXAB4_08420 [Candidatus Hodarchaeales archaeon]
MQLAIKNVFEKNSAIENKVLLLRIAFWIGAVMDGIYALNMSLVWLIDSYSGVDPIQLMRFTSGLESRYAWGVAASLMVAWTCLLIWADRKPVERKDVLLLTAFPLLFSLLIDVVFAIATDLAVAQEMALTGLAYIGLIMLFALSYWNARNIESEGALTEG